MRKINKLSPVKLATLKEPGRYADGGGLYVFIPRAGDRFWTFRYMRQGKARELGLGPLHSVSLVEARERAQAGPSVPARRRRSGRDQARDASRCQGRAPKNRHLPASCRTVPGDGARAAIQQRDAPEAMALDAGNLRLPRHWRFAAGQHRLGDRAASLAASLEASAGNRHRGCAAGSSACLPGRRLTSCSMARTLPARDVLRDALPAKAKAKHHAALPYADLPGLHGRASPA